VAIFTGQMLSRGQPVINGSGEQERDFVYVSDVARANVLALERGDGGVYNIGSGVGTSVNRIFELLAGLTGYDRPAVHGPPKPGEVFKVYLDARRAREELGWVPQVTLEEGLARTVRWFQGKT
jgi:UDP-glucose 4-epimerase